MPIESKVNGVEHGLKGCYLYNDNIVLVGHLRKNMNIK
jgi:hypothetical protein